MNFGRNIGQRDTRITVLTPQDPSSEQGFYDEFGEEVAPTETSRKLWVKLVDRASIGPIIGGQVQNEIEYGLMGDSRSVGNLSINDTLQVDRMGNTRFQVVDIRDTSYRYTSMILIRRHAE